MAYCEARFRHVVVLTRVCTGLVFLILGWSKISSLEFARVIFPDFISQALEGGAAGWYAGILRAVAYPHPGKLAVLVGFVELSIGIGLLLGLAVRPMCALGVFYMVNRILATWNQPGPQEPLWRFLQFQWSHVFPLFVFLLLGVVHAGEHWGLGALYHHHRRRRAPIPIREPFESAEDSTEPQPASPPVERMVR